MGGRILFGGAVFSSAFLLFQVQPLIGKFILPWFGATPGVWAVCLVFFQSLLVLGYGYSHLLARGLSPRRQALVHVALLLVATLLLPITPEEGRVATDGPPVRGILLVLAASIGLHYVLLSSTGPLLQSWFARVHPDRSPYRLYALSNTGSLLALVSYPFFFEPTFRLREQTRGWSWGYACFVVLVAGCAWIAARAFAAHGGERSGAAAERTREDADPEESLRERPLFSELVVWFLLSASGSGLLIATTNEVCLDMAAVPFLWVVPLSLYLLSFVLAFDHGRWYVRPLFCALLAPVIARAFALRGLGENAAVGELVIGNAALLFVACMCLHGELARAKPAPRGLTLYFLVLAVGGAAGGLSVALLAPALFSGFHEYPLLLVWTFVLVASVVLARLRGETRKAGGTMRRPVLWALGWLACATLLSRSSGRLFESADLGWHGDVGERAAGPWSWLVVLHYLLITAGVGVVLLLELRRRARGESLETSWSRARPLLAFVLCALLVEAVGAMTLVSSAQIRDPGGRVLARGRNFYGVLTVRDYEREGGRIDRTLQHGRIMHGFQRLREPTWPVAYYGPGTGVGRAIREHPDRRAGTSAFRLGVVGLGAGTLATYAGARIDAAEDGTPRVGARENPELDSVCFYELNPLVAEWAEEYFSYLADARGRGAEVEVILGDARLVMERQLAEERPRGFHVLVVDAFSSDAIPIHLLTRESLRVYMRHLAPRGVLAFNVTNRYLSLGPILRRLAIDAELALARFDIPARDVPLGIESCEWILMTRGSLPLEWGPGDVLPEPGPLWTDDYSSLFEALDPEASGGIVDLFFPGRR